MDSLGVLSDLCGCLEDARDLGELDFEELAEQRTDIDAGKKIARAARSLVRAGVVAELGMVEREVHERSHRARRGVRLSGVKSNPAGSCWSVWWSPRSLLPRPPRVCCCSASRSSSSTVTCIVFSCLLRRILIGTEVPGLVAITIFTSSSWVAMGRPLYSVMTSPGSMPAFAAGPPAGT